MGFFAARRATKIFDFVKKLTYELLSSTLDVLLNMKGVKNCGVSRNDLVAEWSAYDCLALQYNQYNFGRETPHTPSDLWEFWRSIRANVPAWFKVASVLVLIQPSSCGIERFFSLVKANTSEEQNGEHGRTLAVRSMLLYNSKKG